MAKKFLVILFILTLIGIGVLSFKSGLKKQVEQTNEISQPLPEKETEPKEFITIGGIGFKEGAWSEYKIEGYWEEFTEEKEQKAGKILLKLISFLIDNKKHYGIEIEGKEGSGIEGTTFAVLFDKENNKDSYHLIKRKEIPTLCLKESFSEPSTYFPFTDSLKESLEKEYKVEISEWNFIEETTITLDSGKQVNVSKFKKETKFEGKNIVQELWLSGQVPTYFVMHKETIGNISRSIVLTDFGMEGGKSNLTDSDFKACKQETFPLFENFP